MDGDDWSLTLDLRLILRSLRKCDKEMPGNSILD
jgi:hypothetical protein